MNGKRVVINKIQSIFSETDKPVTPEDILKELRKNFNYDYPILTTKNHNKIIIKKDEKLLEYSFNNFTILYNGMLSYIRTYISWLNLFCYEFFLDIKFKEISKQDIDTIDELKDNLYDKCNLKKVCKGLEGKGKKLSKIVGNTTKKTPSMINAVHLLQYMITNIKNNKQNVTNDFCILTNDFIEYIKIYFDTIPKFKSAYAKIDFDKYRKETITFDEAYNLNFKKYATFILENINILFQNKILLDNLYTDYDYKNTLIPSKNLREQTAKNLANDTKIKKIMNNSNTTIFSTYLYHAAIDKTANEDTTKIIMGKLLKASNQQKFGVYVCDVDIKNKKIKLNKKIKNKFIILGKKFGISEGSYTKVVDSMTDTFLEYIILNKTVRVYYRNHPGIHNNDSGWVDMKDVIKSGMINGTEVDKDALQYIKAIRNKIERDKIESAKRKVAEASEVARTVQAEEQARARAMNRARAMISNTGEQQAKVMNEVKAMKRKANANAAKRKANANAAQTAQTAQTAQEAQEQIQIYYIFFNISKSELTKSKYKIFYDYYFKIKKKTGRYFTLDLTPTTYYFSSFKTRPGFSSRCTLTSTDKHTKHEIDCKDFKKWLDSLHVDEFMNYIEFIPNK